MRVYWRTREGLTPPPHANFFFGKTVERILSLPPPTHPIPVVHREFFPDKLGWMQGGFQVQSAIERGELEKVVLSRGYVLTCAKIPDPFAILAALQSRSQNATLFCQQEENSSFLGATPERLFYRRGNEITAEAIAGTRPRNTPDKELLKSEKDKREIGFVQKHIQEKLAPFCTRISTSPLSIHKTHNVKHLYSKITGTLKTICDETLIDALHPTPAIWGVPKNAASHWIHRLEPFPRYRYGTVLGWNTSDEAEVVLAIRCCEIQEKTVRLYTGAGIVKGSNLEKEWDELDEKLKLYQGIFL